MGAWTAHDQDEARGEHEDRDADLEQALMKSWRLGSGSEGIADQLRTTIAALRVEAQFADQAKLPPMKGPHVPEGCQA